MFTLRVAILILLHLISVADATVTGTSKEVKQGTDVTLSCVVDNITQTETVSWTDSSSAAVTSDTTNYVIDVGTYNDTGTSEQTTTLTVKDVANTEDTTYTCVITSSNDSSAIGSADVTLNVFTVTLDDKSVVTASDQTITCAMTGLYATANVSWTDPDGAPIPDGAGADYTVEQGTETGGEQDSTLTIASTKLLDASSTFTCEVTSGEYPDSDAAFNTMTLTTLTFNLDPKDKEVEEDTTAVISCVVSGITEAVTVSWTDSSDVALTDGSDYTITDGTYNSSSNSQTTTLSVTAGVAVDSTFSCVVTSSEWLITENKTEVALNVFAVTLDDKSVVTASAQTITCAITGLSATYTATVSWTDPDGAAIADGAGAAYTVDQGTESGGEQNSTLTITSTKLQALDTTSTFTCEVTSGEYPDSEPASNTMTLTTSSVSPTVPCDKPTIDDGTVTPADATVDQGAAYTVACDGGYTISAGGVTMTCLKNGTFDQTPTCEETVECERPTIDDGTVTPDAATVEQGQVYEVECDSGFTISGETTMMCLATDNGTFDQTPSCEETVTCNKPLITNGTVTPAGATIDQGAAYTVACDDGYAMSGTTATMTCLVNGTFAQTPICSESKSSNAGVIVGSVIGGTGLVAAAAGGIYLLYIKKKAAMVIGTTCMELNGGATTTIANEGATTEVATESKQAV